MIIPRIKQILRPIKDLFPPVRSAQQKHLDRFLNDISGVVHVGANTGQERWTYKKHGLRVIWIEPIPEVFARLEKNMRGFSRQRALQGLVTDIDDKDYQFHVASNRGGSSSILDLKEHKDIWPDVSYTTTISLKSTTLTSLLQREQVDPREYQALIMDTQGSELLVLQGAIPILENFKYIQTEVADFEAYEDCCQLADISKFMEEHGYREFSRYKFATRPAGGSYYNIVYCSSPD